MRNLLLIIVGLIVLVAVAWFGSRAFVGVFNSSRNIPGNPFGSRVTPTPNGAIVTVTPTDLPIQNDSTNITVVNPVPNMTVSSPFTVSGNARVFENVVSIELTDNAGTVLYSGTAYANAPDVGQFGNFSQQVQFVTNATSGTLTVYQASARDGSRVDVVKIPLQFN